MQIELTFEHPLNHSLQVGDTVWYTDLSSSGGFEVSPTATKLGTVEEVSDPSQAHKIKISNRVLNILPNLVDKYFMFSKDNRANTSSLVGYYAEVSLENNSKNKVELFAVGSEVSQSSK